MDLLRLFYVLRLRLRTLFRRGRVEDELAEELRDHVDRRIEEEIARGATPEDARSIALRAMDGLEHKKEECRDMRRTQWIDQLLQDLRYAVRSLAKNPSLAVVAVASLALGIGANTAIFTLIDAVMLRQLPVRSPDELVAVGDPSRPTAIWEGAPMVDVLSYPLYERLRDQNRVFTGLLAAGKAGRIEMSVGDSSPEVVRGRLVSGNYFDVLGVSPVLGRTFSADDDRAPGESPVIVISYDFWETRFTRDLAILGRTIRLNGSSPFTVIGVGPRRFTGEVVGSPTDVWIPLAMQAQVNPGQPRFDKVDSNWLLGLGRLAPGASVEKARADLRILAQQALADFEGANLSIDKAREIRTMQLPVQPGGKGFSWVRKNVSRVLFTLMAVVGLVLVIACANVANLLLARATGRQRELAVRLAVGASRGRLVRQLLTEGAVLAAIGGAAGLAFAGWGSRLLTQLAARSGPNAVPFDVDVQPDVAVLGFTAAVSLLTTILSALLPAVRSTRVDLAPALKVNPRGPEHGAWSLGKLLVVGQVALSVPLLIMAGHFVRALAHLESVDVGYSPDNLVLVKADVLGTGSATTAQQLLQALHIERLRSLPGVRGVTVSENGLFSGTESGTDALQIEGFQAARREDTSCRFDQVGPGYFRVLGVPLVVGREFDERDTTGAPPVAIVNETMATFYFGKNGPLGKSMQNGGDRYTIVGVVKDNRQRDFKGKPERRFYLPLLQTVDKIAAFNVAIRTHVDSASTSPTIRRELEVFGSNLKVSSIESARVLMSQTLSGERSIAQLSGMFGVLALILTIAGLYGVTSYTTSRRTGEIGVRIALGANRSTVVRMVLRDALMLMAAGVTIGIPAAFMASRLAAASLAGVSPTDPVVNGGALLLMLAASVFAGVIPAIRASRVDPVKALRQE
jgi:predicted permease